MFNVRVRVRLRVRERLCVCECMFVFNVSVLKTIGIYLEEKMEIGIIEKDKGLKS